MNHEHTGPTIEVDFGRVSGENAGAALAELQQFCADHERRADACADEAEWLRIESESLVSWAREKGWLLDSEAFIELTCDFKRFEGGTENEVLALPELGRVLKITKPPVFGLQESLLAYVNNVRWSNWLSGDDIRFTGVLVIGETVSMVTSQPFVAGRSPTMTE